MRFALRSLILSVVLGVVSCGESKPKADTELYGHITIWETMGRGALVHLVNGDTEVQLLIDEDTKLVATFQEDGKTPMWFFDSVYRVDGRMNWAPDELLDENGELTLLQTAGKPDYIWVTRIERLDQEKSQDLIESGKVAAKHSPN